MKKDDILSLFNTVQASADRDLLGISADDKAFCEAEQAKYDAARQWFLDEWAWCEEHRVVNEYTNDRCLTERKVKEHVHEATGHFIENLFRYFREAYNVKLSDEEILDRVLGRTGRYSGRREFSENHDVAPVSYQEIVKDILRQLNGKTFYDTAVEQMKIAFTRAYYKTSKVSTKGQTVSVDGLVSLERGYHGEWRLSYYGHDSYFAFIRVLSHFLTNETTLHWDLFPGLPGSTQNVYNSDMEPRRLYDVNSEKIIGLRFYQNRKVQIKFKTSALAQEFVNTYCTQDYTV